MSISLTAKDLKLVAFLPSLESLAMEVSIASVLVKENSALLD